MIKFFKQLKKEVERIHLHLEDVFTIVLRIDRNLTKSKEVEAPSLVVARHILGSIDVSDAEDPDTIQNDDAYNEYIARAAQFHSMIEKEAKWIMKLQHDFWFTQANGPDQAMFGRGTYNGIALFLERFRLLKDKHVQRTSKKPEEETLGSTADILARLQGSETPIEPVEEKD